jgi:hypothetical protein
MSTRVADLLVETIEAAVVGMAVYIARAILQGKGHNVWEMVMENIS